MARGQGESIFAIFFVFLVFLVWFMCFPKECKEKTISRTPKATKHKENQYLGPKSNETKGKARNNTKNTKNTKNTLKLARGQGESIFAIFFVFLVFLVWFMCFPKEKQETILKTPKILNDVAFCYFRGLQVCGRLSSLKPLSYSKQ